MLTLTDTHCHLTYNFYQEELPEIIHRAWESQLVRILIPAIDLADSREAIKICEKYDNLFAAVGVHPNDALSWDDNTLAELRELSRHPKVVAIGEIGLDYYRDHAPQKIQQEIFKIQLELAAEVNKPVIIHNRDAAEDVWMALSDWVRQLASVESPLVQHPGVMHAFSENIDYARKVIQCGFMLGIGGPLTFKNAFDRQRVVSEIPLSSLLLETDAPFLAPHPYRGKRNEPSYISWVAQKISELKQQTISHVADLTYQNSSQLFKWSSLS